MSMFILKNIKLKQIRQKATFELRAFDFGQAHRECGWVDLVIAYPSLLTFGFVCIQIFQNFVI